MVVITLFSIESEENIPWWQMPISVDSVRQSKFLDIFLSEFLFQNFSWFFLIELNDVQATKTFKICLQQTVSFSIGIPFIEFPSEN